MVAFIHKMYLEMKYSLINKKSKENLQQLAGEAQFHSYIRSIQTPKWYSVRIFRFMLTNLS